MNVLRKLEKINKTKEENKKELKQEAREIWRNDKQLEKEKFNNMKNITKAIEATKGLQKIGLTENKAILSPPPFSKDTHFEK